MGKEAIYKILASRVQAWINCLEKGNFEWYAKHENSIERIIKEKAPHGSGFDNGTTLDYKKSTGEKLVFNTSYHHMNDNGIYDGWTEHSITVSPSLAFDFNLKITGRNRNDIKDYIGEVFESFLHESIERD
jgi:hypothetical protein